MAVELDHTIVPAHDPQASAQFLAGSLGLTVDLPAAQFTPVTLASGVSLGFLQRDDVSLHHYAFQRSREEFEAAFGRITARGVTYAADPGCHQPGQVYPGKNGRRGTDSRDPDGHLMEILTPVNGETATHSTGRSPWSPGVPGVSGRPSRPSSRGAGPRWRCTGATGMRRTGWCPRSQVTAGRPWR